MLIGSSLESAWHSGNSGMIQRCGVRSSGKAPRGTFPYNEHTSSSSEGPSRTEDEDRLIKTSERSRNQDMGIEGGRLAGRGYRKRAAVKKMEKNDWRDKEVEAEMLMRRSVRSPCTTAEHSCTFASASCCCCCLEWRSGSETHAPVCGSADPLAPDPDSLVLFIVPVPDGCCGSRFPFVCYDPQLLYLLLDSYRTGCVLFFPPSLSVLAGSKCEIGEIRRGCSDTPAAGTHALILIKHA